MPAAVPLIGAAFTASAGMTAIAAGSTLVGGLMVAGGAMTALGAVTGNKKLSMLGGVLGLAGGIGGMASGTWEKVANDVFSQSSASNALAQTPVDTAAGAAAGAGGGEGLISSIAPETGGLATTSMAAQPSPLQSLYGTDLGASAMPRFDVGQGLVGGELTGATPFNAGGFSGTPITAQVPQAPAPLWQKAAQSAWDTIKGAPQWIKGNKELAYLGGGLIQGAAQAYSQRQAQQAQQDAERDSADRYNESVLGLKVPRWKPAGG